MRNIKELTVLAQLSAFLYSSLCRLCKRLKTTAQLNMYILLVLNPVFIYNSLRFPGLNIVLFINSVVIKKKVIATSQN